MTAKQERMELMRTFARFNFECPMITNGGNAGTLIEVLEKLRSFEKELSGIYARRCDEYEPARAQSDLNRLLKIQGEVRAIADLLGFKVQFNDDPRGGAIRFILPSGASNGWDGETWGIYW